ncbi:hypothetical protein ACIG56_17310 [Nocardia fusca]|uniref:hypothetical protein n=1 Tax=Nocardia fusca TaxID=941183 RepID=UPI0037C6AD53
MSQLRELPTSRLLRLRELAAQSGNTAAVSLLDKLLAERETRVRLHGGLSGNGT